MKKAVVINGSPRIDKGNTAALLEPFMEGMRSAGANISLYYADKMRVHPCTCGHMACWNAHPGVCVFHDEMDKLLLELASAELCVFGVPVYIQLPSAFQSVLNRMVPIARIESFARESVTTIATTIRCFQRRATTRS